MFCLTCSIKDAGITLILKNYAEKCDFFSENLTFSHKNYEKLWKFHFIPLFVKNSIKNWKPNNLILFTCHAAYTLVYNYCSFITIGPAVWNCQPFSCLIFKLGDNFDDVIKGESEVNAQIMTSLDYDIISWHNFNCYISFMVYIWMVNEI